MVIRRILELEQLGERIVPSGSPMLPIPTTPTPVVVTTQQSPLAGQGRGAYSSSSTIPDTGVQYTFTGVATLAQLGVVQVSGSAHSVGFIASGQATGELTFRNARGSVTIDLTGPSQPGFSPLPKTFQYTVVSATGAYQGMQDQGSLQLVLHPVLSRTRQDHGTFSLTIDGGTSSSTTPPILPKATSGIEGVALVGPISPVDRPGVSNTAPLAGAVISIQRPNSGVEVARVVADQQGRFQINLPPGTYRLVPLPPQSGALYPRGIPQTVTLAPGEMTQVTVMYDSGIR